MFLEACGAGHHWGRLLSGLGHEVKLIAPEAVKPFVKKGKKNDAADAAALCVAGSRPEIKFVPIKSVEQQAVLALHAARSLLVKQQTMLANAMRGLAAEFGLIVPKGLHKLEELMALVSGGGEHPGCGPAGAWRSFTRSGQAVAERVAALEEQIVRHARQDATARRLATIPGIGPITASLIAATVGDNIGAFKSARHFAAWLGLVPRQHSTGGKTRLGRITKAGNAEIRRLLVLGATSMVRRAANWNSAAGALGARRAGAAAGAAGHGGAGEQDGAHRVGADDAQRGLPGAGACPGRSGSCGLMLPRAGVGGGREPA